MKNEAIELSECAKEPIHIPGSIQPHGALLALHEPDLEVVIASANTPEFFGIDDLPIGRRLGEFLENRSMEAIRSALEQDRPQDHNPLPIRLPDGRSLHGIGHRVDDLFLLEIEPVGEDRNLYRTAYRRLITSFDRVRKASGLTDLYNIAVQEICSLTGFDRVMLYKFDDKKNGQVIAEARAPELEPFLGLHYPASDIPEQARALYVKNTIRLVTDVAARPVALEPATHPGSERPLDLGQAVLRSLSPVHCQYLSNMGVRASMSLSILDDGELWGLIACHHRQPHLATYGVRLVADFFTRALSTRISELERLQVSRHKNRAFETQSSLIQQMVAVSRFQDGLQSGDSRLTDLIDCDGAAVLYRSEVTRMGLVPDEDSIRMLGALCLRESPLEVYETDCLSDLVEDPDWPLDDFAGMIAVPISADGQDYLFWFRNEWIREVTWGGDPNYSKKLGPDEQLTPRTSFAAWTEEIDGCSRPWEPWEVEIASDFRTALVASIIHQAAELERLNGLLMRESQQKDRFLAMVSHELRNPLNAIVGWVNVALRGVEPDQLQHALETIASNAEAQTELINDLLDISRIEGGRLSIEVAPVSFSEILYSAVETVRPSADARKIRLEIRITTEEADVIGDARRLQQVVWNLLSNAIKFSDEDSTIELELGRDESNVLLQVKDEGIGMSPDLLEKIFEPFSQGETRRRRSGLGLGLSIVKSIVEMHSGTVTASSSGPGLGSEFRVVLPVAALRPESTGSKSRDAQTSLDLSGAKILVVEDHEDAARMVALLLESHGAEVITTFNGVEALGALSQHDDFDVVLSDLEMPEMNGFELVQEMQRSPELKGIPAVALTAFSRGGDRAKAIAMGFRQHVAKPVDTEELVVVLRSVLGRIG